MLIQATSSNQGILVNPTNQGILVNPTNQGILVNNTGQGILVNNTNQGILVNPTNQGILPTNSMLDMNVSEGPLSPLESSSETSVSGVPKKSNQLQVYYT